MSRATIACLAAGLLSLVPSFAASAWAQGAGALDPTFSGDGVVTTSISGHADGANAVVVQPDGNVVAAGSCLTGGTNTDFCLARYLADGTLDASFGTGGMVTTPVGSGSDEANALVLQPDGKLVAAGACFNGASYDFCLARYDTSGNLDASFGTGGIVSHLAGGFSAGANALVLQPDGKLVAGGACYDSVPDLDFCVVRYDSSGNVETGYSEGAGAAIVEFDDEDDSIWALALQPDGKVVAAGRCGVYLENITVFCLARLDSEGVLDPTFGEFLGRAVTDIAADDDRAFALVLQPDGKLVAAGGCDTDSKIDSCLARYDTAGNLDPLFGVGGTVLTDAGGIDDHDGIYSLALQPDGKIVTAGFCDGETNIGFCLARYDASGSLDATFGTGGVVTTDINPGFDEEAFALALQPDGKLVAAGKCDGASSSDFCLARYDGDVVTVVQYLMAQVSSNPAIPDSIASPLQQAVKHLTDKNSRNEVAACGGLGAALNLINAEEKNHTLGSALAADLRQAVQTARTRLSCR